MKIKKQRERVTVVSHSLWWDWAHMPGAGFSFDCDENGIVDESKLPPIAQENLQMCRRGASEDGHKLIGPSIKRYEHSYNEPAIGVCNHCGRDVYLDHALTNPCECGAEYNLSGQELAPRSQWGWDTGESIDEIMQGNVGINDDVDHLFD